MSKQSQANLARKGKVDNFILKTDFDEKFRKINIKVTSNKTKLVKVDKKLTDHITSYTKLIYVITEVKLISTKGLRKDLINGYSVFSGAKYFIEVWSQNFVFQSLYGCFTALANDNTVTGWISKGFSNNIIKLPTTSSYILYPELTCTNDKIRVRFFLNGSLKQEKMT